MTRIAIFGGTFNPIHTGHLMVAEDIRQVFRLERVIFVSSFVPPHKNSEGIVAPGHRYRMTCLAVEGNPYFEASPVELERGEMSYSVDTLAHFRNIYGPEAVIYFIIGIDAFLELSTWRDVPRIFTFCRFIVVTRPGTKYKKSALSFANDFGKIRFLRIKRESGLKLPRETFPPSGARQHSGARQQAEVLCRPPPQAADGREEGGTAFAIKDADVYLVESVQVDISSSAIRNLVRNGCSVKYLVQEPVEKYILQNNLFLEKRI